MNDSAFVGRDAELARLRELWTSARAGRAGFCFVTGAPGTGKSTLVNAFVRQVQATDAQAVVAVGLCDAQTGRSDAYLPFLSVLSQLTSDDESSAARGLPGAEGARRLRGMAAVSVKTVLEHAPDLIGTFLPVAGLLLKAGKFAAGEVGLLRKLDDEIAGMAAAGEPRALEQEKIFAEYTEILRRLSAHAPLLVVLDDLQWADSASLDLLFHLSRALADARVLVLGTYRPSDVALGRDGGRHPLEPVANEIKRYFGDVWVELDRTGEAAKRAFVDLLLDTEPNLLDAAFRAALGRHTGGHPLFTVELLRSLRERGDLVRDAEGRWTTPHALDWSVLPSRVEGVIGERVGRLEERIREILTVASVEGPAFTTQIVARVQEMRERDLLRILSGELEKRHQLVVEGSLERVGRNWVSQYVFSHVLFQQFLYNGLSQRERMLLHGDVVTLLEELYAGHTDRVAVQLARHHELAGEPERAVAYLSAAGARALSMSAYVEARGVLERARTLLAGVPAGPERSRAELEVLSRLANALNATEGWDSPALVELYYRSRELCQQLDERGQLARIVFGLWTLHLVKLELERALELAQEFFTLADAEADRGVIIQAHAVVSNTVFWLGRVEEAVEYARAAMELYHPEVRDAHLVRYGHDARVIPLMFLAFGEWVLGRPARAAAHAAEGLAVAEEVGHPFTRAFTLYTAAALGHLMRDADALRRNAAALVALCRENGFPFYMGLGLCLAGRARAEAGEAAEGAREIREGYAVVTGNGGRSAHSFFVIMLAEALLRAGEPAEALAALDRGLEVAAESGEICFEAELLRLRAAALGALPGREGEAAAVLEEALAAARRREQPMLELRALADLLRLRRAQGDEAGASDLARALAGVLARVEDGDGLADVSEARALLDGAPAPAAPAVPQPAAAARHARA